MHFRPAETMDGRTAIEIWDGEQLAATLYALRSGLHLVCGPGYEPADIAVEVQLPAGVLIGLTRNA